MKKYILFILLAAVVFGACKKASLQLANPNAPTAASLTTKAGIESFALGLYQKWVFGDPDGNGIVGMQVVMANHSIMGDEEWISAGNWGFRYVDQAYAVTILAPNDTYNSKIINPIGNTQLEHMKSTNSRAAGSLNETLYEWSLCYYILGQANTLLEATNNAALTVPATEKSALQAWAYWWKGFAYSRIGSIYIAGLINDNANGGTNGNFVSHDAIITEANANFDKAIGVLGSITEDADYDATMTAIIPSFNNNTAIITPAMWTREMYTYEARNYLANHKVATASATDWSAIMDLANKGIQQGDNVFVWGMDPTGTNDLSASFWHPYMMNSFDINPGWAWVSERLIQDFKPGDNRFTNGFALMPAPQVNRSGRGLQFGTRWYAVPIEDGGFYSTDNNLGAVPFAGSWEENALMLAEAQIRSGQIDAGLAYVDQVRDAQNSGLAHVAGTGLGIDSAVEELRKERRIGLFLTGVAFYDARRWGVTAAATDGGGRNNAIVMVPGNLLAPAGSTNPPAAKALPCFLEYNYADYWDVPQNELDFNAAVAGSAPIAN